jgi:predicted nucleic acid-binding protein
LPRFVDSSVVLRYLTGDDPKRAGIADSIVESDDLLVSCVILSEVAYALRRGYSVDRRTILTTLIEFVQRENIEIVDAPKEDVVIALEKAKESTRLSLGDAFILAQMVASGCREIYSFDKRFRDEGISILEEPPT